MNKLIAFFDRGARRLADVLRPLVDHIMDRIEHHTPTIKAQTLDTIAAIKGKGYGDKISSYNWREGVWKPFAAWLTTVTWKRLFVVGVLFLMLGGLISSCMEQVFGARNRSVSVTETGDNESKNSKRGSRERTVSVGADGMLITDKETGSTIKVSFDGVVIKDKGENKPTAEVNATGVIITDPETGERTRLGPNGAVPEPAEPAAPAAPPSPPATSVRAEPPAPAKPPAPPKDAVPPQAPPLPSIGPAKVTKNTDGTYSIKLGPISIKLPKEVSEADVREAAKEIEDAAKEVRSAQDEALAEAKAAVESAKAEADAAREAAREAEQEAAQEEREARDAKKANSRVISVNRPTRIEDVIMPMVFTLLFMAILAKVILNTRSKAAAKVAEARQETEREALERQLVEAKLTTMQAQVEPHFLFNTLGSVEYLIEVDPKRAALMQRHLIDYLRAAMPHMRDNTSNMGRESHLIKSYLEILQFRMEERLAFSVDIPPGLHSAEFPPMMLLSLVENCIKHGLEPKPEGGRVDVRAEIVDGRLRVTVADTGLGYTPGQTATSGTGVGLTNIRERLKVLYSGLAGFDVRNNIPQGTVAVIELPYKVTSNLKT